MERYPVISVVIPTQNEARRISGALRQFQDLAGRWELIVADSGSTDGTREIASRIPSTKVISAPKGRGPGMNAGASQATGAVLLFLHADTLLPPGAYRYIIKSLRDPATVATAFRLSMDRPELRFRSLALVGDVRYLVQGTFFGDQAIAMRREDFERIGGYQDLALMEDVDLSLRLRRRGRLRLLPDRVVTSARRFAQGGVFRTLTLMTAFQLAYRLGIPAETLSRWYEEVR
ncbi:MAG: TIGR04283 family arsenosugar biosynthesis glycosyltransferase [Chloroflexota bacterium]